ncbi:hypothetical protein PR048_000627 [Dryococelus australis]|uniref:Galactosylgalactosylxylosylprotein 3-beta-glucuronosyltransferase n=1 Tax=Dryococelus australis TaxID=614101 RepID=A0ABQ9IF68_9NEOP|nr:hypothetical protein PR048_000627 [Dryococelus australis]
MRTILPFIAPEYAPCIHDQLLGFPQSSKFVCSSREIGQDKGVTKLRFSRQQTERLYLQTEYRANLFQSMNQVIGTRLYKTSKWLIILAAVVIFGVQLLKYLLNSSCTSAGAAAATATPAPCTPAPAPAPMTAWSTSPIYVVTATYPRPQQVAELTRLAQTLMHVRDLHWLVVEDAARKTSLVADLLRRTRISFDHLVAPMPEAYKTLPRRKPRGVSNRNRGLAWIRKNATSGVVYFADDDNTYDIEVFEEVRHAKNMSTCIITEFGSGIYSLRMICTEMYKITRYANVRRRGEAVFQMRRTRRVSMWPVGLCTDLGVSSPVVLGGKFAGFYDGWPAGRKFPVDMAGFAVSVAFLLQVLRSYSLLSGFNHRLKMSYTDLDGCAQPISVYQN